MELNDQPDQEDIEIEFDNIDPKDQKLFEDSSNQETDDNENNEDEE